MVAAEAEQLRERVAELEGQLDGVFFFAGSLRVFHPRYFYVKWTFRVVVWTHYQGRFATTCFQGHSNSSNSWWSVHQCETVSAIVNRKSNGKLSESKRGRHDGGRCGQTPRRWTARTSAMPTISVITHPFTAKQGTSLIPCSRSRWPSSG